MKNDQHKVLSPVDGFKYFNINFIPRDKNIVIDPFVTVASLLSPLEDFEISKFSIELIYWPSIPNNITNWRVFDDDQHIIHFLTSEETFQSVVIDDEVWFFFLNYW